MTKATHRGWLLVVTALSFALLTGLALAAPGTLDPSFGTRGIVSTATAPGAGTDFQDGFAIQPDRRILVAGSSDVGTGEFQWRLARYPHMGALAASFGSGDTVLTPMGSPGSLEHIWKLGLHPDGKIVAVGRALTPKRIARRGPTAPVGTRGMQGPAATANVAARARARGRRVRHLRELHVTKQYEVVADIPRHERFRAGAGASTPPADSRSNREKRRRR